MLNKIPILPIIFPKKDSALSFNYYKAYAVEAFTGSMKSLIETTTKQLFLEAKDKFYVDMDIEYSFIRDYICKWMLGKGRIVSSSKDLSPTRACDLPGGRGEELVFAPGMGTFKINFHGSSLWIIRYLPEEKSYSSSSSMKLRAYRWNKHLFMELIKEAEGEWEIPNVEGETRQLTSIYYNSGKNWEYAQSLSTRPLSSIILKEGLLEGIVEDLDTFLASSKKYDKLGIPYQRGYLLEGPPGTGKSSLVKALAGHIRYKLCILNLADTKISDSDLFTLMARLPSQAIVILEDVDTMLVGRSTKGTLNFSTLLNVLDGCLATNGRIVFMTSNYIETLDPALLRPGRVDRIFKVDIPDEDQIRRYVKYFLSLSNTEKDIFVLESHLEKYRGMSIAKIQGELLAHNPLVGNIEDINGGLGYTGGFAEAPKLPIDAFEDYEEEKEWNPEEGESENPSSYLDEVVYLTGAELEEILRLSNPNV